MKLIDADALIEILGVMQGLCDTKAALVQNSKIWQQVKDLPTVDAMEVIKCKDCKWYEFDRKMHCGLPHGVRSKDDYCSDAERKEE